MENCPYCGAPGSFQEAADGCCYVCGMVLPEMAGGSQSRAVEAAAEAEPEVMEAPVRDAATVGLEQQQSSATVNYESTDPPAINLIQPRKLSPEYARRVTMAWQATKSPFKNPQETLNAKTSTTHDSSNLLIGQRSVGRVEDAERAEFELKEVIGEGNMGTVWSARQASLDREVAIKMPKPSASSSSLGRELFISEVVVTGQLDHPNIVPIYDLARDASGQLFYAMKRVEGRSWDSCMHEASRTRHDNVEILMKVCDAIRFAHDRGVIHRDIKPQNIMVGSYGEVSVMDWGIAMRLPEGSYMPGLAKISPSGTPAYMAPEMATGNANEIGMHTDVYLLGAVLYEIITGEPPHPAPPYTNDPTVLQNACLLIAARNVITPAKETGELVDVAYKAMATDISNRFVSVNEFQEAIRDYFSHAESIKLTDRGEAHLTNAREMKNGVYEDYAKARFAFDEAVQLWPENSRARRGLAQASLDYAGSALQRGDYALGLSLLDDESPAHADLKKKLTRAKRKSQRTRFVAAASALIAVAALVGGAAFTTYSWRQEAKAKDREAAQRQLAEGARREADSQRDKAEGLQKVAEKERDDKEVERKKVQDLNVTLEDRRRELATKNEEIETANKGLKDLNVQLEAQIGQTKKARAETEVASYSSEIGVAAARVRRNEFTSAFDVLEKQEKNDVQKALRNWEWGHLVYLAKKPPYSRFDTGSAAHVTAVALSPDQKFIAAGTDSNELHAWWRPDLSKPALKLQFPAVNLAGRSVSSLAISKDGRLLAAASGKEVRFWELHANDQEQTLTPNGQPLAFSSDIVSVALSPINDAVLVSTKDSQVQLLSRSRPNQPLRSVRASTSGPVWQASFSSDGRRFVTAGNDGSVRVWEVQRDTEPYRLDIAGGPIYSAVFSPINNHIVAGGRDGRLLVWDLASAEAQQSRVTTVRERLAGSDELAQEKGVRKLGEHDAEIHSITFAPGGKLVYSASDDNSIKVWDINAKNVDAARIKSLRGHGGWVRSCVAVDDQHVLSGSYDGGVLYWNVPDYDFPRVLRPRTEGASTEIHFTSATSSRDGRWIATAAGDGVVTVWDMTDRLNPTSQSLHEGHTWQATTGVYFRGNQRLLTTAGDNSALVWDAQSGNQLLRIGGWKSADGTGWRGVGAAARNGRWIATGSNDKAVLAKIWDADTGQLVASLRTSDSTPSPDSNSEAPEAVSLAFAPPNDEVVFVGDQWGTCYLFRSSDGTLITSFQGHNGKISAAGFLSNDELLTASTDRTVKKWKWRQLQDPATAAETFRHVGRVLAMDISADASRFITAADASDTEAVLRVYDKSGNHFLTLPELRAALSSSVNEEKPVVRSVALDPAEPRALITLYAPSLSKFYIGQWDWDANSTSIAWSPLGDTSMAAFPPDMPGKILTVGGRGATVRLANQVRHVSMSFRPQSVVNSISFSPNSRLLACAGKDGTIRLWRLGDGSRWERDRAGAFPNIGAPVGSVAFHPTRDDELLSVDENGAARIWRLAGAQWQAGAVGAAAPEAGSVQQAIYSLVDKNSGAAEVLTVSDRSVKIWDVAGKLRATLDHPAAVQCVAVSPDRKWLVTGVGSEAIVWDGLNPGGESKFTLTGHSASINAITFSQDEQGLRLFTAGADRLVKLWDTTTWNAEDQNQAASRELLSLEEHTGSVVSVSFFNGKDFPALLTAGTDGQAILWPTVDWMTATQQ